MAKGGGAACSLHHEPERIIHVPLVAPLGPDILTVTSLASSHAWIQSCGLGAIEDAHSFDLDGPW